MITKIHGILLSSVKHSDKSNIVTLYTAEKGRVSFVSSVGTGKSGKVRNARLSPLALIESNVNFHANRDLQFLGAVSTPSPWRNIYFDPIKAPIALFLSEFLNKILRTSEADKATWHFLISAISALDNAHKGLANYHIAFLIRFMEVAGILPDIKDFDKFDCFDLRTAEFTPKRPAHTDILNAEITELLPILLRMNFRNMHLYRLRGEQRRMIIGLLLRYYSLHLPISTDFKSLDILTEIFS